MSSSYEPSTDSMELMREEFQTALKEMEERLMAG
jgi:hypothetical protein